MAFQIIPILKALAPIVAEAGAAALAFAGLRKSSASMKTEERVRALEEEVARVGEVASDLARQALAIAEELRAQALVNEEQEKKMKIALVISVAALLFGIVALIVALRR